MSATPDHQIPASSLVDAVVQGLDIPSPLRETLIASEAMELAAAEFMASETDTEMAAGLLWRLIDEIWWLRSDAGALIEAHDSRETGKRSFEHRKEKAVEHIHAAVRLLNLEEPSDCSGLSVALSNIAEALENSNNRFYFDNFTWLPPGMIAKNSGASKDPRAGKINGFVVKRIYERLPAGIKNNMHQRGYAFLHELVKLVGLDISRQNVTRIIKNYLSSATPSCQIDDFLSRKRSN